MVSKLSLFIFRRDLRLDDNTALIVALKESDKVIPAFILDPRQLKSNEYFSNSAFQFMISSLKELNDELRKKGSKLFIFEGEAEAVTKKLLKENKISAVYLNKDYTPFSIKRDKAIKDACINSGVAFKSFDDACIQPPGTILKADGNPYTVFTHFFNAAKKVTVKQPEKNKMSNYYSEKLAGEVPLPEIKQNPKIFRKGGRTEALEALKNLKALSFYETERNFPAKNATTGLSPHNKFGTVSIREVYEAITKQLGEWHQLINEIYWRDFFTHIAYNYPKVFGKEFNEKYANLDWSYDKNKFEAWCEGNTGFPIVDAGMRELNETGYMHNRVRMIVSSFLTKDLHIDWRLGEKYFAKKLIDYDPAVNNGNWQWAASTGCDAQPYFRIFNPWLQQKKFDPNAEYIKKWISELRTENILNIHDKDGKRPQHYPSPIIEHDQEKKKALDMYKIKK